jgi:hypothetical protein
MKKFILFFAIAILAFSCTKDEEVTGIDRFIGTYDGVITDYTCASPQAIDKFYDAKLVTTKIDSKKFNGTFTDSKNVKLLDFQAYFETETSDTFHLINFTLNGSTYFANGFKENNKLNIQFGKLDCPAPNGSYRLIKEFIEK